MVVKTQIVLERYANRDIFKAINDGVTGWFMRTSIPAKEILDRRIAVTDDVELANHIALDNKDGLTILISEQTEGSFSYLHDGVRILPPDALRLKVEICEKLLATDQEDQKV